MRFSTAINVFLLGVATVVSALPIAQPTSSLDLESRDDFDVPDMFEREFDEPTLYRRTQYHVALHRSDVGTAKEHWQMHFHPQNDHKSANWHVAHAVSNKEKAGVLETEIKTKGGKNKGYETGRQNSPGHSHMILGSFPNAAKAKEAADSLHGVHCHQTFPGENCVDWTKKAVEHLHTAGHIDATHKAAFMAHYDAHASTVRTNTNTKANRDAAGHK